MRTIVISAALLAFVPTLLAQQVREVSTAEALQMMEQGAVFVDVREADEVASIAYPVAGMVNIPSSSLNDRHSEVPKTGKVIVACASGYRSGEAVKLLSAQGHDNLYSLKGGIVQWQRDGQPVVRSMGGSSATAKPCCAPGGAKAGCAPGETAKAGCAPSADGATAKPCCAPGTAKAGCAPSADGATAKPCCAPGTAKAGCAPMADGATAQACCADGGKKGGKGKKGKKQCCAEGAAATPGCCEKK